MLEGEGKCIARCEANNLDIYTNPTEILEKIMTRVKAIALYESASDSNLDYPFENPNTIVEGPPNGDTKYGWVEVLIPNFPKTRTANKNNTPKIGDKVLSSLLRIAITQMDITSLTTDERYLMLARIALGGKITHSNL